MNIKEQFMKYALFAAGYNVPCPDRFYQSFVNDNISKDLLADVDIATRNCDKEEHIAIAKALILQSIKVLEIHEFVEELLDLYKNAAIFVQENPEFLQKPSAEECSEFFDKLVSGENENN
jgi:hypothetical protein